MLSVCCSELPPSLVQLLVVSLPLLSLSNIQQAPCEPTSIPPAKRGSCHCLDKGPASSAARYTHQKMSGWGTEQAQRSRPVRDPDETRRG